MSNLGFLSHTYLGILGTSCINLVPITICCMKLYQHLMHTSIIINFAIDWLKLIIIIIHLICISK